MMIERTLNPQSVTKTDHEKSSARGTHTKHAVKNDLNDNPFGKPKEEKSQSNNQQLNKLPDELAESDGIKPELASVSSTTVGILNVVA